MKQINIIKMIKYLIIKINISNNIKDYLNISNNIKDKLNMYKCHLALFKIKFLSHYLCNFSSLNNRFK